MIMVIIVVKATVRSEVNHRELSSEESNQIQ